MKKILKSSLLLMLCLFLSLSLFACSGGINGEEAKTFISDFLGAVAEGDYERAQTFLHPERPADLKTFLDGIEADTGLDFSAGIEIERYTGFSSMFYDSSVNGSAYELSFRARVGDTSVRMAIEIVKNEAGYGIYNFNIDT